MRSVRWGSAAAIVLTFGVLTVALAQDDTECRAEGAVSVCKAVGFGTVISNDIDQARDEGLAAARRAAVEQVVGVQVDAETLTRNKVMVDQFVRTSAQGLIQADRIVEQAKIDAGRYRVKIEAWVKAADVRNQLGAIASEASMIVSIAEENMGQPQPQPIVESAVIEALVSASEKFRVMDPGQVQRVAKRDQLAAIARGDAQAAREIGFKFLSNLLIVGSATTRFSQNNNGIVSAYARVTADLVEAETGQIKKKLTLAQVRGFARNDVAAGERALLEASKQASQELVTAVRDYLKIKDRQIEVHFRGLPSAEEFQRAKAYLQKQRFVGAVKERAYAAADSVIEVTYPEKTAFLASRLNQDEDKRYAVREFGQNRILVDFNKR